MSEARAIGRQAKLLICCTILVLPLLCGSVFGTTAEELYAKECWRIQSPPGETRWVEIHDEPAAMKTGIAHISVLSRKKGAPIWEISHLIPHLAITTQALLASVTNPFKERGTYPEAFNDGYSKWKKEEAQGKAFVCEVPIAQYMSSR